MCRKDTILFMMGCVIFCYGCSNKQVLRQDLGQYKDEQYLTVYTTDSVYKFSELHLGEIVDDTLIAGKTKNGDLVQIPINDVEKVVLAKWHLIRTGAVCMGCSVGLMVFVLLMYMITQFGKY